MCTHREHTCISYVHIIYTQSYASTCAVKMCNSWSLNMQVLYNIAMQSVVCILNICNKVIRIWHICTFYRIACLIYQSFQMMNQDFRRCHSSTNCHAQYNSNVSYNLLGASEGISLDSVYSYNSKEGTTIFRNWFFTRNQTVVQCTYVRIVAKFTIMFVMFEC